MTVYPEYAVVNRADPNDDRRQLSCTYRGGFDDPSTSAKDADDVLVDLAAFDVETAVGILREAAGILRGAAETVGLNPADVERTAPISPSTRPGEPQTPGELTLRANVYSEFGSCSITFAGDGTVKRIDTVS